MSRQRVKTHASFGSLVVEGIGVRHSVGDAVSHELVKMRVGPADRHLQDVLHLRQENSCRYVDHRRTTGSTPRFVTR